MSYLYRLITFPWEEDEKDEISMIDGDVMDAHETDLRPVGEDGWQKAAHGTVLREDASAVSDVMAPLQAVAVGSWCINVRSHIVRTVERRAR